MAFVKSVAESEESVTAVMRRFPQQALPMIALSDNLMRSGECAFTPLQREMIAAYTSGTNDCTYCYNTHKATAEAFGVDANVLQSMLEDLEASPADDKLKPVLRFVRKLTQTPSRVVQSDVDAIFEAGWDEDCYHYAVMICAMFNMMNRIMDGYGVRNTAAGREKNGQRLAYQGYGAVADAIRNQA